jgi:hypothetical protein
MMNSSNISLKTISLEIPSDITIYGSVFYSIIFLMGIVGNLLVLYLLIKEKELRNFTNYLLANLSISDLLVLFACVPTGFHDLYAKERWYLGEVMCHLIGFIENCMTFASILTILFITCERYYVICMPLKLKSVITPSRTFKLIILIWLISITVNLPFIFLSEYKKAKFYDNNVLEYKCSAKPTSVWTFYYIIVFSFSVYFIIGFVLLLMYYKITKNLELSNKILYSTIHKENMILTNVSDEQNEYFLSKLAQEKIQRIKNHSTQDIGEMTILKTKKKYRNSELDRYIKPRKQLIFMLMCIIISFYVCLFPLKIWSLILMFFAHEPFFTRIITLRTYMYINITTRIFFYMNSSINPILYNCLSKKFKRCFKKLFTSRFCCNTDES